MITKLRLENFLSYRDVTVLLDGATISVVGDNGSGKSSLLESIPYAYFGIGRETQEGMSRLKGDGTHKVTLWEDDGTVICRGRRKSGTGFFQVKVNGELVAKGREADQWVHSHLGMNGDTFMLTAFFGLHDVRNDTLIKVTPANRLEALQRLAEIGPYKTLLKRAKSAYSEVEIENQKQEAKKLGAEASRVDEDEIHKKIDVIREEGVELTENRDKLRTKKSNLSIKIDKYQTFVKERSDLAIERAAIESSIADLEEELSDITSWNVDNVKTSKESVKTRDSLQDKNQKVNIEDEEELLSGITQSSIKLEGRLHLLSNIEESDSSLTKCPLCSAKVPENQVELWRVELEDIRKTLKENKESVKNRQALISGYYAAKERIHNLQQELEEATLQSHENSKRSSEIDQELRKLRSIKSNKDSRFIDLQEKLGNRYREIHTELSNTSDMLEEITGKIESKSKEISMLRDTLASNEKTKKLIKDCNAKIKECKLKMGAYKLLISAWNRYGIPMNLVKGVMQSIEEKATAIYQEFDSGRILVPEVIDRGKPGVDFILKDRKGSRSFNQLSAGEKVMFFIAVRVAISQIISEKNPVSVDYLVLDEAMGNLSPKRREDLIRITNKVLRKMFPQLLIVSHTVMSDIFTTTIQVTARNDESTVKVL